MVIGFTTFIGIIIGRKYFNSKEKIVPDEKPGKGKSFLIFLL
jgi:hypothetical protein